MTLEETFELHHRAVFSYAYRLTRRLDTAEDITQDCFLAFARAQHRFDPARASAKTYLFSIAHKLAAKRHRDNRPEVPLDDEVFVAPDARASSDLSSLVEQAVSELPPMQREALILFAYEGFTLEEIGGIVGADSGTVKSRLHRAREALKRRLAPAWTHLRMSK